MSVVILKMSELEAIKAGQTRVYRRWLRPSVKAGGTLRTAMGVLRIDAVEEVERGELREQDATATGYSSLEALLNALDLRDGEIYLVALHYEGADPRIALREVAALSDEELRLVLNKLARLDAASRQGPWTLRVLQLLERHPKLASVYLAKQLSCEQQWLKLNVRKLKNLGLTISHELGYEVSARGLVVLRALEHAKACDGS